MFVSTQEFRTLEPDAQRVVITSYVEGMMSALLGPNPATWDKIIADVADQDIWLRLASIRHVGKMAADAVQDEAE